MSWSSRKSRRWNDIYIDIDIDYLQGVHGEGSVFVFVLQSCHSCVLHSQSANLQVSTRPLIDLV